MKKKKNEQYTSLANTLYTNYKAEVFACGMIQDGLSRDKVRIIRKGKAKRSVSKEVEKIVYEEANKANIYTIYIHKRDLYDSLPKGLFHDAGISNKKQQKSAILKSIEKGREEEFNARYFFKPFEMFLDYILIGAQLYERQLEKPQTHPEFVNLFVHNWKFLKGVPLDKALFLLNFLSQSHRITNNEEIAQILSYFLECDVRIENSFEVVNMRTPHQWRLGEGNLGQSSFIGGVFVDTLPVVLIKITNLPQKHRDLIYTKSTARKQLHILLDLFIPADAQLNVRIEGRKQESLFALASDAEPSAILGFSTILQ
ncbi:MAG: type VI secretion system baseplate subunit TssG [Capnocytophaga sp.]|nr:type VI secretion system baseplate subunit TssG [Capnocytophaga sp.]